MLLALICWESPRHIATRNCTHDSGKACTTPLSRQIQRVLKVRTACTPVCFALFLSPTPNPLSPTNRARQVTLISGGGSGHEPAFAGYVGEGMLTAAVCGGVFASPAASAVLEAIRAACGPCGCLVLVMNYTGDRLNFGMAVEQAKAEGFNVRRLVISEFQLFVATDAVDGAKGLRTHTCLFICEEWMWVCGGTDVDGLLQRIVLSRRHTLTPCCENPTSLEGTLTWHSPGGLGRFPFSPKTTCNPGLALLWLP